MSAWQRGRNAEPGACGLGMAAVQGGGSPGAFHSVTSGCLNSSAPSQWRCTQHAFAPHRQSSRWHLQAGQPKAALVCTDTQLPPRTPGKSPPPPRPARPVRPSKVLRKAAPAHLKLGVLVNLRGGGSGRRGGVVGHGRVPGGRRLAGVGANGSWRRQLVWHSRWARLTACEG